MLNPDFKEFIQLLNEYKVRYILVGGYAVACHGHPRYTKDLDIWVWVHPSNINRLLDALRAFGFASVGLTQADFLEPDVVIQLGYPPSRIDLTTNVTGLDFNTAYDASIAVEVDGVTLTVIGLEHLRINKRATGRLQDLADVEALED